MAKRKFSALGIVLCIVVFCICTIAPRIVFAIKTFRVWSGQKICREDRALALKARGPGLDSRLGGECCVLLCSTES